MAGCLAKKLYSVPFVLTTHSLEPLRAWKAEQLGSGYALSSWMERTAILDADAIIAVSQGTKADILRVYPDVDPGRIHVIYNGIDLAEYQKTSDTKALTEYGVDPAVPYVLFVGRVTRQKGVTHLVDAVRYLPPDVPGCSLRRSARRPGNRRRIAHRKSQVCTPAPSAHHLDQEDGRKTGGNPALQQCPRLLLSLGLRTLRHHQPRSHGLPRPCCRQRYGRHQRGSGRRRNRLLSPVRSGPGHKFPYQSREICARSCRCHHLPCSRIPRNASASATQDDAASKRSSAGQPSPTRQSASTIELIEQRNHHEEN